MSSNIAKAYHSITFGSYNTYDRWHLVPDSRPVIAMPEQKKEVIDIPGGNGVLDMSMALTKFPLFNRRTGSIKFHVLNNIPTGFQRWDLIYENISNYLHGQKRKMILDDDPDFYYIGYYTVTWTSNNDGSGSEVEIGYDLEPYKYSTDISWYSNSSFRITTPTNRVCNLLYKGLDCLPTPLIVKVDTLTSPNSNDIPRMNVGFVNYKLGIDEKKKTVNNTTSYPYLIEKPGTYTIKKYPICSNENTSVTYNNDVHLTMLMSANGYKSTADVNVGYRRALL